MTACLQNPPEGGWRAWKIAVCVIGGLFLLVVIATLATCCAIHRRERACIARSGPSGATAPMMTQTETLRSEGSQIRLMRAVL
jgi:hypothetical protein